MAYATSKLSRIKMGKAEHLPPQSSHQVMPDVSAWVEDVLPEGHRLGGG